jgi:D-tyrosyl-tRNA(Tyr) deacylase
LLTCPFNYAQVYSRGRRPGFDRVATPDEARRLYELFADKLRENGVKTETGIFQAEMLVRISNDGPVTVVVDSR